MKIPTVFIPERNIDIERLLKKPELHNYDENKVMDLLGTCQEFVWELEDYYKLDKVYYLGNSLAEKIRFTAWDINELSKRITVKYTSERYLGFYLSALVNKIAKEYDQIELEPHEELFGLGAYLPTGKLAVRGNLRYFAGAFMSGGVCIIDGNSGKCSGNGMTGGKLIIYGDAGEDTGIFMTDGVIRVGGSIKSISSNCKGTIHSMGKKVWPLK